MDLLAGGKQTHPIFECLAYQLLLWLEGRMIREERICHKVEAKKPSCRTRPEAGNVGIETVVKIARDSTVPVD